MKVQQKIPKVTGQTHPERRSTGRPNARDTASLERKLLDVALEEFLQHGYRGASMTRIVQQANVSKTTLYARYPSKADLFRAMLNEQIERSKPSRSLHSELGPLSLERGLIKYADDMLKFALKKELRGVERLLCSESHHFPELGEAANARNQLGVKRIAGFIEDCAERDGIPCSDPYTIAEKFISLIRGWFINVIVINRNVTAKERRAWVSDAVQVLIDGRERW